MNQDNQTLTPDETVVAHGSAVKTLDEHGRVGGYLVRFTSPDEPDLEGDYFSAKTDFGTHQQSAVLYHHGLDKTLGIKSLGGGLAPASLRVDDVGVWVEAQLDLRDEYEQAIYRMAGKGKLGWSSGTASHLVKRTLVNGKAYHIDHWPLGLDASLTPQPAAGLQHTAVVPLKTYAESIDMDAPSLKAFLTVPEEAATASAHATADTAVPEPTADAPQREPEPIKTAPVAPPEPAPVPPVAQEAVEQGDAPEAKAQAAVGHIDPPDTEPAADTADNTEEDFPEMDAQEMKALMTEAVNAAVSPISDELNALKANVDELMTTPDNDPGAAVPTPAHADDGATHEAKRFNALYQKKFTSEDSVKAQVMNEAAGGNYAQLVYDQSRAFAKMLRDPDMLDGTERRLLKNQVFAPTHVMKFVEEGFQVSHIKNQQMVAQGSLGGYAMPPNMQEAIATRLPGLTAVRGNGATVVTLVNGNSVDVPVYTGTSDRYTGNLRGAWGSETSDPASRTVAVGEETIKAEVYLYKIPMTMQMINNAGNLLDIIQRDITDTLAMDEDTAFLIGNGVKRPLGILPDSLNAHALKEVDSGNASTLTAAGVKQLKRGVPSQYRENGTFVGNSDTYGIIETLTTSGTGSDYAFGSLSENATLLRRPAAESGSLPDVAANAFPLLFGVMRGYYIVETPGMTVMRMQDTQTSVNKAELHVMKQVGGRPVELWQFAVQKVAE